MKPITSPTNPAWSEKSKFQETPMAPSSTSGDSITPNRAGDNIRAINQEHWIEGTFLGALTRNAEATMKMSVAALKVAGNAYITAIIEASPAGVVPQIIVSSIGLLFYGGSLISSAALKAAIWVPVLSVSFFSGLLGGTVGFIFSGFNQEYAKKGFMGVSDVTAKVLSNPVTLAASLTVFARGPVHLLGMVGGLFLGVIDFESLVEGIDKNGTKESFTLAAALFQTCEDSYALWTLGCGDVLILSNPQKGTRNTEVFLTTLAEIGANFHSLAWHQKSPFYINWLNLYPKNNSVKFNTILNELGILSKLRPETLTS